MKGLISSIPILLLVLILNQDSSFSSRSSYVELIQDHKEFKKLLRTKNNILVHFSLGQEDPSIKSVLDRVSVSVKGIGTLAVIDCDSYGKLCKKLKVSLDKDDTPSILKHYHNGAFHKDYNRALRQESLVHFLKDPTGDIPWDEDPEAQDVRHLHDPSSLNKLIKRDKSEKILIMFYAPWCGFCKRLKPVYQKAASTVNAEVKGGIMAAMDVNTSENAPIRKKYNITAFPTLLYFEGGEMRYTYPGNNEAQSFVDFLKNPSPEDEIIPKKIIPLGWKDEKDSQVIHLDTENFESVISKEKSINVMFYAPWCGHCKKMKPHFTAAANKLKEEKIDGKLAAVDCTVEDSLCKRFQIRGYPTVKYFKNGEFAFDSGHAKDEKGLLEFMKNPSEPPPPPPPEKQWSEEESEVHHLTSDTFKPFLKKKKHVLVIFYAPWCGHCKRAKPEFTLAAKVFKDNPRAEFAAVDCTMEEEICRQHKISGYPTIKYFSYFNKNGSPSSYEGGRSQKSFTQFMVDKISEFDSKRNEL